MIAISLTFNKTSSQETRVLQIRSRLADPGSLLPWEEGGLSERDRGSIGRMWGPIQKLLVRDPLARGTVQQFCVEARQVFVQCHGSRFTRSDSRASHADTDTRHL